MLLLLGLSTFVYYFYYGQPARYEADSLVVANMFNFTMHDGGQFTDWPLPFAGYYFDFALYWIVRLLAVDIHVTQAVCSVAQVFLFFLALYSFYSTVATAKQRMVALALVPMLLLMALHAGGQFYYTGIIMYHVMAFIHALFAFSILFYITPAKRLTVWTGVFCCVCSIGLISDHIFLLWCILPCLGYLVLQWLATRNKTLLRTAVLLVLTVVASKLLLKGIQIYFPSGSTANWSAPSLGRLFVQLLPICGIILKEWLRTPFSIALCVLGGTGIIVASWQLYSARKEWRTKCIEPRNMILLLTVIATGMNVGAVAALREVEARYLMVAIFLPVYAGCFLLVSAPAAALLTRCGKGVTLLAVCVLAYAGYSAWAKRLPPYYPKHIEQIDAIAEQYGYTSGAANFWYAQGIMALSQKKLHIVPLEGGRLMPLNFNGIQRPQWAGLDFILCDPKSSYGIFSVHEGLVTAINGQPDVIAPIEDMFLYGYKGRANLVTPARLYLTPDVYPPPADRPDETLWSGNMATSRGLVLYEVKRVIRDKTPFAVFLFHSPVSKLLGQAYQLDSIGDRSPVQRKWAAKQVRNNPEGLMASVYYTLFETRKGTVREWEAEEYAGGSMLSIKMVNRENKRITDLRLVIGDEVLRILPVGSTGQ